MKLGMMATVAAAFARTRWRARVLRDRGAITRYQARRVAAVLAHAAAHFPYYRALAHRPFDQWPVIDKAELVGHFTAMNRAALSADQVRDALAVGASAIDGWLIGQSTGTSGNRGYYVIDQRERFVWLGTLLAKALPDALWRRHRVALALPVFPALYDSASGGSRITLGFFDLATGVESWADELTRFAADTIVAPPKVLRWLAERGRLTMAHVFSAAELLDPVDEAVIAAATGRPVRQIYMATEGLFGVSCTHGTLHLAEDAVRFDWERPDYEKADQAIGLVMPVVTDFTRRAQALIRYRMNDLIELDATPCPCGSAYQAVKRIEGRADDIFLLPGADDTGDGGTLRMVTPDVLRNALVDSHAAVSDYRLVQDGPNHVTVTLDAGLPAAVDAAVIAGLAARFAGLGLSPELRVERGLVLPFDAKLRRVRRDWRG